MKSCKSCGEEKELSNFGSNGQGYATSNCKVCLNLYNKEYRKTHAKKPMSAEYWRKYRLDPSNALTHRLRNYLRKALVRGGISKTGKTFDLLGYSKDDFLSHIETLKTTCCICHEIIDSEYHIAHLEPVAFANTEQEIINLFKLENLACAHPFCNQSLNGKPVA
jgi:hypothetical protein